MRCASTVGERLSPMVGRTPTLTTAGKFRRRAIRHRRRRRLFRGRACPWGALTLAVGNPRVRPSCRPLTTSPPQPVVLAEHSCGFPGFACEERAAHFRGACARHERGGHDFDSGFPAYGFVVGYRHVDSVASERVVVACHEYVHVHRTVHPLHPFPGGQRHQAACERYHLHFYPEAAQAAFLLAWRHETLGRTLGGDHFERVAVEGDHERGKAFAGCCVFESVDYRTVAYVHTVKRPDRRRFPHSCGK